MADLWQQVKIITSFDDLIGVNVHFWAKLLDMTVNIGHGMGWYSMVYNMIHPTEFQTSKHMYIHMRNAVPLACMGLT